jgi:hypothetical protein
MSHRELFRPPFRVASADAAIALIDRMMELGPEFFACVSMGG